MNVMGTRRILTLALSVTLAGVPVTGNYDFNVVRAGLNYRF